MQLSEGLSFAPIAIRKLWTPKIIAELKAIQIASLLSLLSSDLTIDFGISTLSMNISHSRSDYLSLTKPLEFVSSMLNTSMLFGYLSKPFVII